VAGPRPFDRREGFPSSPEIAAADLLAEGEELVAGRRPVEEAFVARRAARRLLVVPQRREALERLVLHATSLRIPVVEVEGGTLTAIAGFDGHQGIALVVDPRTWAGIDDVLARAAERGEPPFVLALDSLEDPQNVGTLLRSAEAAGVHGVIFPTHRQAPLTPAAVKASAGAVEHLLLCPVDDLPAVLSDLRLRGLRVAAAEADAPLTSSEADLRGPLAVVVGSEGGGLSPAVRRRADLAVRIPMRGAIASLNAAVAGSILLFAAVAQRDLPERPGAGGGDRGTGLASPPADESVAADLETAETPAAVPAEAPVPAEAAATRSEARPARRRSSTPRTRNTAARPAGDGVPDTAQAGGNAAPIEDESPADRDPATPGAGDPDHVEDLLPGGPPTS
jgi:23S rRNA (guanosine2251-2'-O)-methyltransferase